MANETSGTERVRVTSLDHLVLTVADVEATVAFYEDILGRTALVFGVRKMNPPFPSLTPRPAPTPRGPASAGSLTAC